jgi:hypothetical protein
MTTFKVEIWPLEKVSSAAAEYNPRVISERMLDSLARGIEEFGFLLPAVINTRTNRLVGGHQRVKASQKLGLTEVPVHVVDLPEDKEKLLNLALNRIEGKWDYALLEESLTSVAEENLLTLTGFNESDLVEIMSGMEDYQETFEEFAQKFSNRSRSETVSFRSAQVMFTCSMSAYEDLCQRLYAKVGVDDVAATNEFFELIGLGAS